MLIQSLQKFKEGGGSDFTNFFLAFPNGWGSDLSAKEKDEAFGKREGVLELCWNHGTGELKLPCRLLSSVDSRYQQ